MKHNYKKRIQEFTFILPAMILFLVFVVYPFLQGFPISFTKCMECYKEYPDIHSIDHVLL